jgi:hypothetical protein
MFFGTIPQELTFYGPAPVATFTLATVRISIPDEEDDSIALTPKGTSNNVMTSPINYPKRRRRPSKKAAPATVAKTAHNSQASRKRALNAYQNQLVARPASPVSNRFMALHIVAKNSVTGQLRQAWEVPKPTPRPTQMSQRRQHKSQVPTEAIYKTHRALKQRKSVRNAKSRQHVSRPSQSEDMAQLPAIVPTPRPRRIISKATPSVQQVWVPKGFQPTKPQSQAQPSKADNPNTPPESVFSRLGSKIPLDSLKITTPDQKKKKRRTARYEEHFSVNTISISYDTDPDTDTEVNMSRTTSPRLIRPMLPIPARIMEEKEDLPRGLTSKLTAGTGKTIMKIRNSSIMKMMVKFIPKCLSMKLKFLKGTSRYGMKN